MTTDADQYRLNREKFEKRHSRRKLRHEALVWAGFTLAIVLIVLALILGVELLSRGGGRIAGGFSAVALVFCFRTG